MSFGGVYVAATRQHVGKTSSSLGLVAGLQRIFTGKGVGFIKPMGQSHVEHVNDDGSRVLIDKDCPLFSDLLGCRGTPTDMSPLLARIRAAHGRIADDSEFVVAEGTGHTAVGSILGLNNATLATALDLPMLLVVNGGVGSAFDEFALNHALIDRTGGALAGVLVNKVAPDKIDTVRTYLGALLDRQGVPLLGVVPDRAFFSSPTVADYLRLFETDVVAPAAGDVRTRHFEAGRLACGSTAHFLRKFKRSHPATLWVIHQSRADLILALASGAAARERESGEPYAGGRAAKESEIPNFKGSYLGRFPLAGGLVLTGRPHERYPDGMDPEIAEFVLSAASYPIFLSREASDRTVSLIDRFTAKLSVQDEVRARAVVDHYSDHVDFGLLLDRVEKHRARAAVY
ncbi:hypothetical protein JL722_14450 [Aureococcus anophagefferens]|nr:hypothetical protein JL722_14450 [Aureococcus anophagefferens]